MSKGANEIERNMEAALRPGRLITDGQSWDFVSRLEKIAAQVRSLVDDGQPATAVSLYETFIAGCYEKAEEIDDSSGSFGTFAGELFCGWVRARQAAMAEPRDTIERLLSWMEDDDYGFCHRLELDVVKELDADGLREYEAQVRTRLDASAADDGGIAGYPRRQWIGALKQVLTERGDADGYLALGEGMELTVKDCDALAEIYQRLGKLEEALAWVERGLTLAREQRSIDTAAYELERRKRELLPRLGRADEAIAAAWASFEGRPSDYAYEILMELVPENERAAWHDKAMSAAADEDLSSVIPLFVEQGEVERLARRIAATTDGELEELSHFTTEPAAKLLAEPHPALAARVFRALGLRIVNAKKSRYYDAALHDLERARDCYSSAGEQAQWEALVAEIRRKHARKGGFMEGFERLAAGYSARAPAPSFLERARSRWPKGGRP